MIAVIFASGGGGAERYSCSSGDCCEFEEVSPDGGDNSARRSSERWSSSSVRARSALCASSGPMCSTPAAGVEVRKDSLCISDQLRQPDQHRGGRRTRLRRLVRAQGDIQALCAAVGRRDIARTAWQGRPVSLQAGESRNAASAHRPGDAAVLRHSVSRCTTRLADSDHTPGGSSPSSSQPSCRTSASP